MPEMNIIQAVNDALSVEMERDESVVVMGEDVGQFGGVFRATQGLQEKFGTERVFDTPLAEAAIVGAAIGMALNGLRPVSEIQFADYIYPAFDQIVNELAKYRYRSGGQYGCPLVIRAPYGGGIKGGHYHSQSPEAYFIHTAGLKVVIPSSPYDAKGLLISAIRDEDPVLFFEPKRLYRAARGEVPAGEFSIPLGKAARVREGDQCTVIAYGAMLHTAREGVDLAAARGIRCDLIDLRTLMPFDAEMILESVKKTGRAVIVHEAPRTCGFGAELSATIAEKALLYLEAPVLRITGFDTPFPYVLERLYLPGPERVLAGIEQTLNF